MLWISKLNSQISEKIRRNLAKKLWHSSQFPKIIKSCKTPFNPTNFHQIIWRNSQSTNSKKKSSKITIKNGNIKIHKTKKTKNLFLCKHDFLCWSSNESNKRKIPRQNKKNTVKKRQVFQLSKGKGKKFAIEKYIHEVSFKHTYKNTFRYIKWMKNANYACFLF